MDNIESIEKRRVPYRPNKEVAQELNTQYYEELNNARRDRVWPIPLHLYSRRVYRAYRDAWYVIDRSLLTPDEIEVMKELGVYKLSRTERGIPRHLSQSRTNALMNRMSRVYTC